MCPMNYTMPPKRRSWLCFLMIPVLVLATIFLLHAVRSMSLEAPATAILEPPAPAEVYEPPQAPDPSEVLLADVYASEQSAIDALARRAADVVSEHYSNPQEINVIRGAGVLRSPHPQDVEPLLNVLRSRFPTAIVAEKTQEVVDQPSREYDLVAGPVWVILQTGVQTTRQTTLDLHLTRVDAERHEDHVKISTRFIDRRWAADPAAYINDNPDRNLIIGRCGKVAMSEPEARRAAEEDAVRQAAILIQQHELNRGTHFNGDSIYLLSDVRGTLPIKDRFVQKFHRTYGDVWSESVLVDASGGWLESMSQRHAVAMYQHETRVKRTTASAFIVLITILIAYLFLNAVTKSYFTARLRFVAILFAVGVMVMAIGIIARA